MNVAHLYPCPRIPTGEPVSSADYPAAELLLLTIGHAGVLSSRVIATEDLAALFHLLGAPSERQRSNLEQATDIVLIEDSAVLYWPRTGEQFHIADASYAMARVQATLAA